ncbi:tripartite tricarboxylate transporter substrate binding protein [Diaphorobacter ruginosibacter]|uniref:tripartite tricarboxylate transporter substrate binding protein n=1 Tax=Diaphorobacter ruginosibacter TaxID=1715720 RepID=UPI00334038A5
MTPTPSFIRRSITCAALAWAVQALGAAPALAADGAAYPGKPITLIVPYPPGGSNDVFARQVAKEIGDILKQPVIVDNRPGASGNTGTATVAKAAPDGYTLVAVSSSMTTNAGVQPKMPFDPVKNLAPVAMLAKGPMVVAVNNDFPASTPAELIKAIKDHPGKFNYATSGTGSVNHMATEYLRSMVPNFEITHVPYKGQGPAVTDVIGNQVQMLISSGPSILPMIRSGKLKAVGITSLEASPIAPDLTPMATAVPGYEFDLWWGMLAPAGTPADVIGILNKAVNQALAKPQLKEQFLREGAIVTPITPAQFGDVVKSDVERWKKLARQRNIVAD